MEEGEERNGEKKSEAETDKNRDNENESHLLRPHFLHLKINMFFTF